MSVKFNTPLLEKLVLNQGGVGAIIDAWYERFGDQGAPNKTTVHRWINAERLPGNSAKLMKFSTILDVDPFCLFVPETGTTENAINALLRRYQLDALQKSSLRFLTQFFGWRPAWPPTHWPDAKIQHPFNWHTQDFTHDTSVKANYYTQIALISDPAIYEHKPQTFHFAYSGRSTLRSSWLHYGFVVRHGNDVSLMHIHGCLDKYEARSLDEPSHAETWFGPGDANFRVASLHPFTLRRDIDEKDIPARVRFPG